MTNDERPKVLCVIPARLESKRLPGKVLLDETGKPLIQHVWENANKATLVDHVLVACETFPLTSEVERFGATCFVSKDFQETGTDRVAEAARINRHRDFDIIINLQADEPDITGEDINQLVLAMMRNPQADMATMAWKTNSIPHACNASAVKVVFSEDGRAVYFSRCLIPRTAPWWIHAGVYAFRRNFLLGFALHPQSTLEKAENLEQLRALEMGANIHVEPLSHEAHGINTAADYRRFVRRQSERQPC